MKKQAQLFPEEKPMRDCFWEYHDANPTVYERLLGLALQVVERGQTDWSIWQLWQVLRWQMFFSTEGGAAFKLPNNFTGFYSRVLMYREPRLEGLFALRNGRHVDGFDPSRGRDR